MTRKPICIYMPDFGETGVMQLWFAVKRSLKPKWKIEVRGKSIRDYDPSCPFHILHDIDRQINLSTLHADEVVTILPEHEEVYNKIFPYMDEKNALYI